jgi:hypothetical protein
VEFLSKKVARRVADQLNNTQGKNQDTVSKDRVRIQRLSHISEWARGPAKEMTNTLI